MSNLGIGRVGAAMLLVATGAGCVYSDHYVDLSSSAVSVERGVLTMPEARRELQRTIFYPIGFSFCWGHGHDGLECLLSEWICHIPTFMPEIVFNNINDRQWVQDIRLPVFATDVSVAKSEFLDLDGGIEGRKVEVPKRGSDGLQKTADQRCVIEFHASAGKSSGYDVMIRGTIYDGSSQREVDFGLWRRKSWLFAHGRNLYVVSKSLWHYTEWFLYRYHDTGANPVLWRVDPYTGEREVLVSFDTGKFIIENPPRKVESSYR